MRLSSILIPIVVVLGLLALATLPTGHAQPTIGTTAQYLPVVFKDGIPPTVTASSTATLTPTNTTQPTATSTTTSTPSATKTEIPSFLRLINGDFESGQTGWGFIGGALALRSTDVAHSGQWSALLGDGVQSDKSIRQTVLVPIDRPYLSFWYTASSEETTCFFDYMRIIVDANVNDAIGGEAVDSIFDFCSGKTHAAYQQKTIDLRIYVGQTVQLDINMVTGNGFASIANIDDVSFVAQP